MAPVVLVSINYYAVHALAHLSVKCLLKSTFAVIIFLGLMVSEIPFWFGSEFSQNCAVCHLMSSWLVVSGMVEFCRYTLPIHLL